MRLRKIITISLFVLTGFFCFAQSGTTIVDSIFSGGISRKFRLYIPLSYDGSKPVPLVMSLHEINETAAIQQTYSNYMLIADTAGFLVLHPQGSTSNPYWNAGLNTLVDDVMFISQLIDSIKLSYNIDLNKVYCSGYGNGGVMSYYLACHLPNKIAAVASVAGSMYNFWILNCKPYRAVPVMEIHGTLDGTVNYAGSAAFASVDSVARRWLSLNKCASAATSYSLPDATNLDNSHAVNYLYSGGTDGSTVEVYKVIDGSHSWPGAATSMTNTNYDFSASQEIWRFFRKFKLSQFVTTVGLQENQVFNELSLYPSPANDFITIAGLSEGVFTIYSIEGRKVISETSATKIAVSSLAKGIYFLKIKKYDQEHMIKFVKD